MYTALQMMYTERIQREQYFVKILIVKYLIVTEIAIII